MKEGPRLKILAFVLESVGFVEEEFGGKVRLGKDFDRCLSSARRGVRESLLS